MMTFLVTSNGIIEEPVLVTIFDTVNSPLIPGSTM